MQLQAAIVPPQTVLQDALAAAQTIHLRSGAPSEKEKPGIVGRLFQRQSAVAAPASTAALAVVASTETFVRLGRLGHVTSTDARTLARALSEFSGAWPAPVVHVADLDIELSDTLLVIIARLGGDIDGLRDIFSGFNDAAKAHRFFLDRRNFRPEFKVASIALPGDPSFLDRLEWDADAYRGPDWQVSAISMLGATFGDNAPSFDEVETLTVGVDRG